jgi:sulfur-oxidizing protein SoxA
VSGTRAVAVGLAVAIASLLGIVSATVAPPGFATEARAAEATAAIDPDAERAALVRFFEQRFPGKPLDDYVLGGFMLNPSSRAHYEDIMAFPPFLPDIERGKALWETPLKNGRTYADCLPDGGRDLAGRLPRYDAAERRVVTFEMLLNRCRRDAGEPEYRHDDRATMGLLSAWARTLSDGMRMDIRVDSPGAREKWENGRRLFHRRIGQMNFACVQCHVEQAGRTMRMEVISPVVGQATHFPLWRSGDTLYTPHMRFVRCMEQVRAQPFAPGSEAFNDLEYYHASLSNGLPLQANVYRR